IDQTTHEVNLLVEDTAAVVRAPGLESLGVQEVDKRRFAAYRAGPLAAGDKVEIVLPQKFRAQMVLPYVIAILAAGMVLALVWSWFSLDVGRQAVRPSGRRRESSHSFRHSPKSCSLSGPVTGSSVGRRGAITHRPPATCPASATECRPTSKRWPRANPTSSCCT